jgi:hypothetical protein
VSFIECLEVFHQIDIERYLSILKEEFGARAHPAQADCYLIDDPELPFYQPRQYENHMSVLGFNRTPLSSFLILALIDHPELAPAATIVRWSAEQELVAAGTLEDLANLFGGRIDDPS